MSASRAMRWTGIVLFGLGSGLLLSLELYFNFRATSERMDLWELVVPQLVRATMWSLQLPLILQLGRLLPPTRARALAFHFFASFTVMATFYLGRMAGYPLFFGEKWQGFWGMAGTYFYGRNIVDMLFYWAALGFGQGLEYHRRYRSEELRAVELESKLIETELRVLKHQLNPHFLFNTMNTIAVLVRENRNDDAVRLIARLSTLLRMSLENTRVQTVTLRQELEFLTRYLEIQKARFGDKLNFRTEVESAAYDAVIPNLILQPAVENAILHGIAEKTAPGMVEISARVRDRRLELQVRDDGPGFEMNPGGPLSEGIGLTNTRVRLERHYGKNSQMVLRSERGKGVTVSMVLPFQPAHPVSP
jgi:two-component system, LytTR family, sensor kinase